MKIKILKLRTGEAVIAGVEPGTVDMMTITNPVIIILQPTKQGLTIVFHHLIAGAAKNQDIMIPKDAVLTVAEPDIQVLNQYQKLFGSGIQIVNSMPANPIQ